MSSTILGIDLGTMNMKISSRAGNKILCEKNVIAIEDDRRLYAFGDDAYEMYEKAPDNIKVSFPIKGGVIADFKNMQDILLAFLNENFANQLKGSTVIIAVPTDITEVEKRAYYDLVDGLHLKLSSIMVCDKPIAVAIGLGLPVTTATGMMIIDIGADTTEISVLSLGGIVISKLIKMGGNKMADAIIAAIKRDKELEIGRRSAENILSELGFAKDPEDMTKKVVGRNVRTGFPVSEEISSLEVYDAIKDFFDQIVDSVKFILERTPPELTSDIIDNGMYLSGGVSNIRNIDTLLSEETELDVNKGENPIVNVAMGLEKIAAKPSLAQLATAMGVSKGRGRR